jgi:protocatechuate 3,4-dioxygenase beta subunit
MQRPYSCAAIRFVSLLLACAVLAFGAGSFLSADAGQEPAGSNRFTPPPGEENAPIKALIDKAQAAVQAGKSSADLLTDPAFLPAHEWPRFRQLIRNSAKLARLKLVTPQEPGEPLVVKATVSDKDGKPVPGALVYVYHTSAKGWYSDRAAHVGAREGDRKHARLFGYLTTDTGGAFELGTIRPAGYPDSNLPAHIHVEIEPPGGRAGGTITEIRFDDDPRLTGPMREQSRREGFTIAKVQGDARSGWRLEVNLRAR